MKSPSDATAYTHSKADLAPPAPFVRRGFRETETTTTATATVHSAGAPFGAVVTLPLAVQATFRRKLIAIIALQLGVLAGLVALLETTSWHWRHQLVDYSTAGVLLGVAAIALLAVLNRTRDKFPANWIVLVLLTGVLAVGLTAADTALEEALDVPNSALDAHIVLANCVFTWIFVVGLVLTAGWTQPAHARYNCCDGRGMTFGWSPPTDISAMLKEPGEPGAGPRRVLVSPIASGFLSFLVACGVTAVVDLTITDDGLSRDAMLISFFVQFAVCCWFLFQVDSSPHRLTPDAYMSGVIYFYADVLVVLGVLAVGALLAATCASGGGDGGAALSGVSLWAPFYPTAGSTSVGNRDAEEEA